MHCTPLFIKLNDRTLWLFAAIFTREIIFVTLLYCTPNLFGKAVYSKRKESDPFGEQIRLFYKGSLFFFFFFFFKTQTILKDFSSLKVNKFPLTSECMVCACEIPKGIEKMIYYH